MFGGKVKDEKRHIKLFDPDQKEMFLVAQFDDPFEEITDLKIDSVVPQENCNLIRLDQEVQQLI